MDRDQIRNAIEQGNTALGIEFGSTRIKAVLVDGKNKPIAQGSYDWENRFEEGIWTYRLADAQAGLISCFRSLKEDVNKKYDITLHTIGAMGVSAMMHGYMAFDQNQKLLEFMGLSPLEYRILSADWYGESYEDEEGRMCRQAMVWGQKLLRDYEAEYEGEVSWIKPETQELEMVYRQISAVSPAALETAAR